MFNAIKGMFNAKKVIALGAMMTCLACVPGTSRADTLNDGFGMQLNVEAHCEFYVAQQNMLMDTTGMTSSVREFIPNWMMHGITQSNSVWVKCNQGLPYQLELDTSAGGLTTLTEASSGYTVDFRVRWGNQDVNGAPWGQIANGEAYSGVGTGQLVNTSFTAFSAWQESPQYTPKAGTYSRVMTANLVF